MLIPQYASKYRFFGAWLKNRAGKKGQGGAEEGASANPKQKKRLQNKGCCDMIME